MSAILWGVVIYAVVVTVLLFLCRRRCRPSITITGLDWSRGEEKQFMARLNRADIVVGKSGPEAFENKERTGYRCIRCDNPVSGIQPYPCHHCGLSSEEANNINLT